MNNRQQAFVIEYTRDFNATRAAKAVGYSDKTAYSSGQRLLKDVEVWAAIQARIAEKTMGADEVLTRLADHARGDIGDFLDINAMGFVVDLYTAKQKGLTHLIKKVKLRTQTSTTREGIETETHDMEVELYDAQSALALIGKHHKLFTERNEITGAEGGPLTWRQFIEGAGDITE